MSLRFLLSRLLFGMVSSKNFQLCQSDWELADVRPVLDSYRIRYLRPVPYLPTFRTVSIFLGRDCQIYCLVLNISRRILSDSYLLRGIHTHLLTETNSIMLMRHSPFRESNILSCESMHLLQIVPPDLQNCFRWISEILCCCSMHCWKHSPALAGCRSRLECNPSHSQQANSFQRNHLWTSQTAFRTAISFSTWTRPSRYISRSNLNSVWAQSLNPLRILLSRFVLRSCRRIFVC